MRRAAGVTMVCAKMTVALRNAESQTTVLHAAHVQAVGGVTAVTASMTVLAENVARRQMFFSVVAHVGRENGVTMEHV